MAVSSHAQKNQVKAREAAIVQVEVFSQNYFVLVGRAPDAGLFGLHAVHISLGNGNSYEEFAPRRSIIAFGTGGRNRALVAPENVYLGPIHLPSKFVGGQKRKHLSRRISSG